MTKEKMTQMKVKIELTSTKEEIETKTVTNEKITQRKVKMEYT